MPETLSDSGTGLDTNSQGGIVSLCSTIGLIIYELMTMSCLVYFLLNTRLAIEITMMLWINDKFYLTSRYL